MAKGDKRRSEKNSENSPERRRRIDISTFYIEGKNKKGVMERTDFITAEYNDYTTDKDGKRIRIPVKRTFERDPEKKQMTTTKVGFEQLPDKTASKKALRRFFQKRAEREGFKYTPRFSEWLRSRDNEKIDDKEQKFIDTHKDEKPDKFLKGIKTFKTTDNLIILTSQQGRIKRFDLTYVNVRVKVFFDGFYVISTGRSSYFNKEITQNELPGALNQAIRNALAPYGSNLNFELLDWNYAYWVDIQTRVSEVNR